LAAVLIGAVLRAVLPGPAGIPDTDSSGNPGAVATAIFTDYPFTLELVGTLLIVAALGAVVLTHRTRIGPRQGQKELSIERVKAGVQITPHPAPGVYAGRNALDVPAIDAAGQILPASVPEAVRIRGQVSRTALPPAPPSSADDAAGPAPGVPPLPLAVESAADDADPPPAADGDRPPSSADDAAGPAPAEEKGGEE
jgi:NADH-quinone oxidoreductase subunit J